LTETASATLIGFLAIPIWALLSALTVMAGAVPPLELVAITFTVGALAGALIAGFRREERKNLLRVGFRPVVTGIAGLFGYHFAYFLALQNAPPVEASLVNYLWPVLIVVFSAALPARVRPGKLSLWHLAGVAIAFAGAAFAIGAGTFHLGGHAFGYGMALLAALIWSTYSVVTRLFQDVRSATVALYCFGTAVLAWAGHLLLERSVWPQTVSQWLAIAALGIGPLGAAFFAWDYGCKRGDLRLLGICAYFAPVLSTALLAATGLGAANSKLWLAALLITGGALLSSADTIRGVRTKRPDPGHYAS
jgi:drug/metabolite transporter (DMT)-like permease